MRGRALVPLLGGGHADLVRAEVVRSGRVIGTLTGRDVDLLAWFAAHPGEDVTREVLATEVLRQNAQVVSRAVDSAVFRLRTRIERDAARPEQLITVQGVGYRWVPPAAPSFRSDVPPARDRLVGREAALAELASCLAPPGVVVSIVGSPGIGKTALALEAARRITNDDVLLIELGPVRGVDELTAAVSRALDVADVDADTHAAIGFALSHLGAALLVLDDADGVVEALPSRLSSWRRVAPDVRWLVTSRATVDAPEVRTLSVGPLASDHAAELFLERARAVRGEWQPDDAEQALVVALADRLDGVPLALELAASRTSALSTGRLLERFTTQLPAGPLAAAIEQSWDLLDDTGRATWTQLSVFADAFDEPAVAQVVRVAGDPMRAVLGLVARSLVVDLGQGRYRLLHSLRAFAEGRWTGEDPHDTWRRHAAWVCRDVGSAGALLLGKDGPAYARRWVTDAPDFRLVAERFETLDPGVAALALLSSRPGLVRFSADPKLDALALSLLDRLPADALDTRWRIRRVMVFTLRRQGQYDAARTVCTSLLSDARASNDPGQLLYALADRASLEMVSGHAADAIPFATEGVALARSREEGPLLALLLSDLAVAFKQCGQLGAAANAYAEALAVTERFGAAIVHPMLLMNMGVLDAEQGRPEVARERFRQAIDLHRSNGNLRSAGIAQLNLAQLDDEEGDVVAARDGLERTLAVVCRTGSRRYECVTRSNLGGVLARLGLLTEANVQLDRAAAIALELGHGRDGAVALAELGLLAWIEGDLSLAQERLRRAVGGGPGARNEVYYRCFLAGVDALLGADGEPELARARALHEAVGDPGAAGVVQLMTALIALVAGDAGPAREALTSPPRGGGHVRLAWDRLGAAVSAADRLQSRL